MEDKMLELKGLKKKVGSPKMTQNAGVQRDMKDSDLQIEMLENQNEGRRKIHVDNHLN